MKKSIILIIAIFSIASYGQKTEKKEEFKQMTEYLFSGNLDKVNQMQILRKWDGKDFFVNNIFVSKLRNEVCASCYNNLKLVTMRTQSFDRDLKSEYELIVYSPNDNKYYKWSATYHIGNGKWSVDDDFDFKGNDLSKIISNAEKNIKQAKDNLKRKINGYEITRW